MNPTLKIVAYKKATQSGRNSISVRVTYLRKVRYFSLGIQCKPDDWSESFSRLEKTHKGWQRDNERIALAEHRAATILIDIERSGKPFSFQEFKRLFYRVDELLPNNDIRIVQWIMSIVGGLETDSPGNATIYRDTASRINKYGSNPTLSELDRRWIERFEAGLRSGGCGNGGTSIHLRTLRAACNRAIKDGIMPKSWYPFKEYSLTHLKTNRKQANAGKALTEVQMKAIETIVLDNKRLEFARDMFMFSFFNRGMNLADIARTTKDQVDDRIKYVRQKTKRIYSIKVRDQSKVIVEKYAGTNPDSPYLFPILDGTESNERQKMIKIEYAARSINSGIKKICRLIGIDSDDIIFYSARHSYATILLNKGVNVRIIQEALGHSDLRTTESYLKSFDDSVIDSADDLLM